MQIHISQTTKDHLEHEPYSIEERGKVFVKGKGYMKTYWLKGKKDLSFKTPAELRYNNEQKSTDEKSLKSVSPNAAKMAATSVDPEDLPGEVKPYVEKEAMLRFEVKTKPPPKASSEFQEKDQKKKKKSIKGEKPELGLNSLEDKRAVTPVESPSMPLYSAKISNRGGRLPADLPVRSTTCKLF
nr:PREDICTED: receptor-type guanylate cyclase gcy-4-like [Latimeria chalumnae]|eukprot:XP_014344127.1 PREDICTED: receptor-type guanylate cyclase gcy-4-like [Latimeria chalumnae]